MADQDQQKKTAGIFITFEGGDGAGKTTHITFLASCLRAMGHEVICLREPGGTSVGEDLRAIVLDPKNAGLCAESELLIYEAARAQIIREVIIPALARGAVVLLDRFYDSTIAYQVYGRGLPMSFVRQANSFACQGVIPVARSCSPRVPLPKKVSSVQRTTAMPIVLSRRVRASMRA